MGSGFISPHEESPTPWQIPYWPFRKCRWLWGPLWPSEVSPCPSSLSATCQQPDLWPVDPKWATESAASFSCSSLRVWRRKVETSSYSSFLDLMPVVLWAERRMGDGRTLFSLSYFGLVLSQLAVPASPASPAEGQCLFGQQVHTAPQML